jgi:HEAT repeat protein
VAAVIESSAVADVEKHMAVYRLSQIPGPSARIAMRNVLKHSDESLRVGAAAALLAANETDVLPVVERALLRNDRDNLSPQVIHNLTAAVTGASLDSAAVPALGRLLQSPDVQVRRAAATALKRVDSEAAVPVLAVSLDDPDWEVQYHAIVGLSSLTRENSSRPSLEEFRREPRPYLEYWKDRARKK